MDTTSATGRRTGGASLCADQGRIMAIDRGTSAKTIALRIAKENLGVMCKRDLARG